MLACPGDPENTTVHGAKTARGKSPQEWSVLRGDAALLLLYTKINIRQLRQAWCCAHQLRPSLPSGAPPAASGAPPSICARRLDAALMRITWPGCGSTSFIADALDGCGLWGEAVGVVVGSSAAAATAARQEELMEQTDPLRLAASAWAGRSGLASGEAEGSEGLKDEEAASADRWVAEEEAPPEEPETAPEVDGCASETVGPSSLEALSFWAARLLSSYSRT